MPSEAVGRLRVDSAGDLAVTDVRRLMEAIEGAYGSALAFEYFVELLAGSRERFSRIRRYSEPWWGYPWLDWPPLARYERRDAGALLLPSDQLVLHAASISSPGFWEFLGKLNPLDVIRQYFQDRHVRRQDREYREGHEDRQLGLENRKRHLENQLLENQVLRERVELLDELGFGEGERQQILNEFLYQPLQELDDLQDRNIAIEMSITRDPSEADGA